MFSFAAVVLDSLILATLSGGVVLGAALWAVARFPRASSDLRHRALGYALFSGVVVLVASVGFQPGPVGCFSGSCAAPAEPTLHEQAHARAAHEAAGKFRSEAPESKPLEAAGVTTAHRNTTAAPTAMDAGPALPLSLLWLVGLALALMNATGRWRSGRSLVREAKAVDDAALHHHLASVASDLGIRRAIRVLHHPDVRQPMVGGWWRPWLFVPADFGDWPKDEVRMVLLHELSHIRERDPLVTAATSLVCCVFWFNPLVWIASRRMRHLQELAADSNVLRAGVTPSRYARYLIDTFREMVGEPAPRFSHGHAMVGPSLLEARVRTILDPLAQHRLPGRLATASALVLFVLGSAALTYLPAPVKGLVVLAQDASNNSGEIETSLLRQAALDSLLRPVFINTMADRYISGAAISVVYEGDLVYLAGFGSQEVFSERPVDADRTIFRIGSITKVLTGIAVLQLVDRGLLDLDADVNDYLTELEVPDNFDEPVRVRNLLTHTSGFDQIGLGRQVSGADQVRPLGDFLKDYLIQIRAPGEVSAYDTYAITLAGYLVEQVSGLSYEEYLRQNIFEPLGMTRSGILVPEHQANDAAVGYTFAGTWEAQPWEFMNTDPASTVNSTALDMSYLARMLLGEGAYHGARVLSRESASAMLTQQYTNDSRQPGYSYTLFEDRRHGLNGFGHGGSMSGFGALLYLLPEHDLGVFISYTQESSSLPAAVMPTLLGALLPGQGGPPPAMPLVDGVDPSRFVGTYANNTYHHTNPGTGWSRQPFDLELDGEGGLRFRDQSARPVGPMAFQLEDGLLLTFREDEEGSITHMLLNQAVFERLP